MRPRARARANGGIGNSILTLVHTGAQKPQLESTVATILIKPVHTVTQGLDKALIDGITPVKGRRPKLSGEIDSDDRGKLRAEWDCDGKCLACFGLSESDNIAHTAAEISNLIETAMLIADDTPPPEPAPEEAGATQ